ncbi:MAG: cell division protein FtsB [Actinobacteria bacterium 69-20]|nr:DUF3618 domain-containing protein [Actinomycetota bacterium]OJV25834.1 MAG: cell division protein FtsB [Actinobacteria bacterium 69-20]
MVRDAQTIQAEIERARDGLAVAVDELTTRLDPKRAVDEGKRRAQAIWANPKVKLAVVGVGALVAFVVIRKIFR